MKSWQWPEIETRYPWLELLVLRPLTTWQPPASSHNLLSSISLSSLCNFNRLCCKISDALSMYLQVPKHALYSVSIGDLCMSHVNHMTCVYVRYVFVILLSFLSMVQSTSFLYTRAFRGRGLGTMLVL